MNRRPEKPEDSTAESPAQHASDTETPAVRPPPNGGYGWVVVTAQFFVNGFTWGIVASYSVYLSYYLSNSLFPSARPLDFALIGGLNFSAAVLIAPPATALMRLWGGPRGVMCIGLLLLPGGLVAASFARQTWHLYLSQGLAVGLGVGLIYMPASTVVPQWFSSKTSLANGICAAGSGIGGLAMCFATDAMLRRPGIGLPGALRVTAGIALVVNAGATAAMRSRNEEIRPKLRMFDVRLLKSYHVLLLLGWSFTIMFGYITLMFSLSDYADAIGLVGSSAAAVPAVLNLGAAFGRPFIGFVSDRFGRVEVAAILTFACSLLIFALWIPATTLALLLVFAFLSGAILGIFWSVIAPLAKEIGGLAELPSMLSLVWLSISLPTTFAEVIALELRTSGTGARTYLHVQIFAGLSYFLGGLVMLELWRSIRVRKRELGNWAHSHEL